MKEYECVQVGHHKNVGKTIEEWQKNGWRLHTYQATGFGTDVKHITCCSKKASDKMSRFLTFPFFV